MEKKNLIELKNIAVSFDDEPVLKNLNLSIADGEFFTLLGPSGCGKTTTLRIIGGFITPDAGDVFFDGKRVNDLPAYKRPVNTIFQRYALFPHLNVYENIAFGMRVQKKKNSVSKQSFIRAANVSSFAVSMKQNKRNLMTYRRKRKIRNSLLRADSSTRTALGC